MTVFIESVVAGVIGNLIFSALLIWIVQRWRYWYYLKREYHGKKFEGYWKSFPQDINFIADCKVYKNIIQFHAQSVERYKKEGNENSNNINKEADFTGEFILDPISLKSGKGFHVHLDNEAFGFSQVILKGKYFYVESPYINVKINNFQNKEGYPVYQAFVWKRKDD